MKQEIANQIKTWVLKLAATINEPQLNTLKIVLIEPKKAIGSDLASTIAFLIAGELRAKNYDFRTYGDPNWLANVLVDKIQYFNVEVSGGGFINFKRDSEFKTYFLNTLLERNFSEYQLLKFEPKKSLMELALSSNQELDGYSFEHQLFTTENVPWFFKNTLQRIAKFKTFKEFDTSMEGLLELLIAFREAENEIPLKELFNKTFELTKEFYRVTTHPKYLVLTEAGEGDLFMKTVSSLLKELLGVLLKDTSLVNSRVLDNYSILKI